MSKITQYTIAEKAGVSAITVSRVINNKPDVNPKTRKKILKIINELNYVPNLLAKSLKSGKSKTIGVIVSNLYNPFFNDVLCGINEILNKKGYSIIVCNSNNSINEEEKNVLTLIEKRVDGILITPVGKKSLDIMHLQKIKIPSVLFMSHINLIKSDYVGFNDQLGSFQAAEHLISRGHKKILYLHGPTNFSLTNERLRGFKKALFEYGIEKDESLFKEVTNPNMTEGYKIVKEILCQKQNFTAIATFNDYVAIGVLKAVLERNLKVPEDIAIIGYDDIEFASLSIIPLTTIQLPKFLLGKCAAQILLSKMIGQKCQCKNKFLKPKLVIRDST